MSMITKTSLLLFLSLISLSNYYYAYAATFTITNKCGYTVWPAAIPNSGSFPTGGRQLNQGETWSLNLAAGTSGRIWGRTGCNFDGSGNGRCETGDCGSVLNCKLSGEKPTTLAEFTLNGGNNQDYYDISVIDGYNVAMEFTPNSPQCQRLICNSASCPDAYLYPTDDTKTHACDAGTNYGVVFCP